MRKQYDHTSVTAHIQWEGKALIALRSNKDNFLPGYWEQVGGKVDQGETNEAAVIREVKEEAGIDVRPVHLYNEFSYTHHRDSRSMCEFAYICELSQEPQVSLSFEHQEYRWITLKELTTITPMTQYMQDVIKKGFNSKVLEL